MNTKEKNLIRLLVENSPSTAAQLAETMNVSIRSIKNYVYNINNDYPNTIISSNKGYTVQLENIEHIFNKSCGYIPETSNERVSVIINKLLNHKHNEEINIFDLCDEMFISLSTIRNDIKKVKRRFRKFNLEMMIKKDNIYIEGLEKNKRKMLSTILYEESNVNFVNLQSLQEAFINIDIDFIRITVLNVFEKYHYYINDYSLINLVLHITIAIDRIRNDNFNNQTINSFPNISNQGLKLSHEIANRLENQFHVQFSQAEIYEMTLLIISRASNINYKSLNVSNLENFISPDILILVNRLLENVKFLYDIDLSDQEFFIRFALHIQNLIIRSENNCFTKNPLTEKIKISCPLIYDISVNLAQIIKETTGNSINDDEIAYIAFHLGSTLESQKNLTTKITAILYCPNYYNLNQRIVDTIKSYFDNDLLITDVLTDESYLQNINKVDFIISTIPLSVLTKTPTVFISLFVNEKDRHNLADKIRELQKKRQRDKFENYLRELLNPNFFEHNNAFKNKNECIHYLVGKLRKYKYVNDTFEQEILDREGMSSTAFNGFAIPHTMKMNAKKTILNILISDKGIMWDGQNVNIILMMCFNSHDRYIFNETYEPITMILGESNNIKKLTECNTYEDFITTMINLL